MTDSIHWRIPPSGPNRCGSSWRSGRTRKAPSPATWPSFEGHVAGLGAWLVRPDRKDEPRRFGPLGGMRQWIESVINTLKDQLGLEQHRGRTLGGVVVRVAQRLLALAAVVWFNWQLGVAPKRSLLAFDH